MHFTARLLRSTAVVVTGAALCVTLWMAAAPNSVAQGQNPQQLVEAALPQGQTMATAGKADLLRAVCQAVRKNPGAAPQIVRVAVTARQQWSADILRSAFECMRDDCRLKGRTLSAAQSADPDNAASLAALANELAPNCEFGGGPAPDEGDFGAAPLNMNPPPGSIGGRGGQGNLVAICHNGRTIFVSPRAVDAHLRHGDRLGPCQVTPTTNP